MMGTTEEDNAVGNSVKNFGAYRRLGEFCWRLLRLTKYLM